MGAPSFSLRRLHTVDDAQIDELAELLIDCVLGGASVSFMHPLSRDTAVAFWRRVAQDVVTGKRALLVAEDERGLCGTVQLVLEQPENQPHRADLAKMLVHRRARRRGWGPRWCAPPRPRHATAARRSSYSTPSRTATERALTNVWAGFGWAISRAMPCFRKAGFAVPRCSIATSGAK